MIKRFTNNVLWAQDILRQHRYKLLGEPQIVRTMPWSTVISFRTSGDFVYLKCMAKEFAYEAALLEFLNKQKFLDLPNVIATNNVDGSFLMHDAGEPLRLTLTRNYDISIVCNALRSYAKLQIDCMNLTEPLIKRGASDWRLINLPQLYQKFLLKKQFLIFDGLTLDEIEILQNLSGVFESLCQTLGSFNIPETLEHGDFHDNNILLNKDKITINDFGDSTISYPFFSIALFLNSSKRHYNSSQFDKAYVILRDCYLQEWESYADKDILLQAFEIALLLQPFVWSLNLSRVESCTGPEGFPELRGHVAEQLRILISSMTEYKNKGI